MKNVIHVFIYTLCLYTCNNKDKAQHGAEQSHVHTSIIQSEIDSLVSHYLKLDIFSGVVLVAEKGEIIFHKAYGLSDRATNSPNTTGTLFDIGSMNKTFTSIVVKQLIAERKLDMEDHLTDFIDGFKDPNVTKITIKQLLEHRSGFGDYHTPDYFELPKSERLLNSIVERAKTTELNFEPGEEDEYSNLGYVLLGAVIEKVSGKSYFEMVKERIIDPLKLKNTYLNDFSDLGPRIAKGYYYTPLGQLEVSAPTQDVPNPDGGFLSTTSDILKFYRSFYYDDLLLSDEIKSKDPMFIYLRKLPPGKATVAAGGFEGFNSALFQVYHDDLTIIVFANMDEPVAEHLAMDILSLTRGETPEKPKLPAIQNVRIQYEKNGLDFIKTNFEELTTNYHPEDPKDFILNDLGYAYLYGANNPSKAEELFKLNTDLFPDIANCWDSYGEVLMNQNKIKEAELAYKRALKIRPELESAAMALKKLTL
jgi:CubicO group peptidase (beta-lactamase class C family)